MFKIIDIDYETRSVADLLKVGAAKYAQDPTTQILYCSFQAWDMDRVEHIVYFFDAFVDQKKQRQLLRRLRNYLAMVRDYPEEYKVAAFHSEFEYHITKEVGVRQCGFPSLHMDCFFDVMSIAGANSYPAAAEAHTAMAMRLKEQKDSEGKRLINMFCKPSRKEGELFKNPIDYPQDYKAFGGYCDQDVRTQIAIREFCTPLNAFQIKVLQLTERMNARGAPIDIRLVKGAIRLARKDRVRADKKVFELTGGEVHAASQTKVLTEFLNKKAGAKIANLKAATIQRRLLDDSLPPLARELLILRQSASKTSVSKFKKALIMAARDGRVHGILKAYLTITGRAAGRGLQIQNFSKPDGKLFPSWGKMDMEYLCDLIRRADLAAIEQAFGDVMDVLKGSTRSMIRAPEGMKFITADYSQVEARVTFWLARCEVGLQDFAGDGKIYEKMAGSIFNKDYRKIVKGHWERDLGKETVLGCGFGMGVDKFFRVCTQDRGLKIGIATAKMAVKRYRTRYEEVPAAWKACERAAIKAIQHPNKNIHLLGGHVVYKCTRGALRCQLPSGRFIFYPEATLRTVKEFNKPALKMFYANWKVDRPAGEKWSLTDIWGGTLFQHMVQAIASDLIMQGLIQVEESGYPVIFTVHDEGVSMVAEDFGSVEEYESILCKKSKWAEGIPLVAEGWQGPIYKK